MFEILENSKDQIMNISDKFNLDSRQTEKQHKLFLTASGTDPECAAKYAQELQTKLNRKITTLDGTELSSMAWDAHYALFPSFKNSNIVVITNFDILLQKAARNIHKKGVEKNPDLSALRAISDKLRYRRNSPIWVISTDRDKFHAASATLTNKNEYIRPLFDILQKEFDIEEAQNAPQQKTKKSLLNKISSLFKK